MDLTKIRDLLKQNAGIPKPISPLPKSNALTLEQRVTLLENVVAEEVIKDG